MKTLEKEELKMIKGGGLSFWGIVGIITGFTFVVGFFDGLSRPIKCD
ncbi:MAG: class IIb bacteriocin, lactobin A/cerein 7B family [bacterium]|nr:class IIb bacteriocin, lactobin A/cerein 7B family [bacterium]